MRRVRLTHLPPSPAIEILGDGRSLSLKAEAGSPVLVVGNETTVRHHRKAPVRCIEYIDALFTFVMVILPLSSSRLNSISRYYLIVFPVFILLVLWSNNVAGANRHYFIVTVSKM